MDIVYFCIRKILKPIITLVWIKEIKGMQNIPRQGSAILAMNHQSYFDFLCIATMSPRNIHFLAAEKFFEHWLWSILMRVTRQIKVNRTAHDKQEMHKLVHSHIDSGRIIGIFPEGTRSPHESDMLRAFSGVAKYALAKKVPVIPIGIGGTYHVMSRHATKIRFKKMVSINVGKPVHCYQDLDDLCATEFDYRKITHLIMKEISLLSGKTYNHEI